MKVINLLAGPGSGKSTTAAGLFFKMKLAGYKVELVTEVAKDYTYEQRDEILGNQLYLLAKQDQRQRRLLGHVDYIITDSPLLFGWIYVKGVYDVPWFRSAVLGVYNTYDNINFLIKRVKPYAQYGRSQTEDQAREKDKEILNLLRRYTIPYIAVNGDATAPDAIMKGMEFDPEKSFNTSYKLATPVSVQEAKRLLNTRDIEIPL